jgi:3-isopropylmalate dehydratase
MPGAEAGPRTLYDKVFQDHIVDERLDGTILLYVGVYFSLLFAQDM